jgi:hypothetical protein
MDSCQLLYLLCPSPHHYHELALLSTPTDRRKKLLRDALMADKQKGLEDMPLWVLIPLVDGILVLACAQPFACADMLASMSLAKSMMLKRRDLLTYAVRTGRWQAHTLVNEAQARERCVCLETSKLVYDAFKAGAYVMRRLVEELLWYPEIAIDNALIYIARECDDARVPAVLPMLACIEVTGVVPHSATTALTVARFHGHHKFADALRDTCLRIPPS